MTHGGKYPSLTPGGTYRREPLPSMAARDTYTLRRSRACDAHAAPPWLAPVLGQRRAWFSGRGSSHVQPRSRRSASRTARAVPLNQAPISWRPCAMIELHWRVGPLVGDGSAWGALRHVAAQQRRGGVALVHGIDPQRHHVRAARTEPPWRFRDGGVEDAEDARLRGVGRPSLHRRRPACTKAMSRTSRNLGTRARRCDVIYCCVRGSVSHCCVRGSGV